MFIVMAKFVKTIHFLSPIMKLEDISINSLNKKVANFRKSILLDFVSGPKVGL